MKLKVTDTATPGQSTINPSERIFYRNEEMYVVTQYNPNEERAMSLYDDKYVFEFQGRKFEKLPRGEFHEGAEWFEHDFREIFSEDDYDYVEDEQLIQELHQEWQRIKSSR